MRACSGLRLSRVGRSARWVVAAWLLAVAGPAAGDVMSVSVTPRSVPISSVGASAAPRPILVRWSIQSTIGMGAATSASGVFRAGFGGPVIGSVPSPIVAPISGGLASASETVRVPSGLAQRATELGASLLVYERSWDDTDTALSGSLVLVLGGGKGGAFEAQRVELSFDDGSSLRMVDRGGSLRPRALLSYSGSGVVEAVWEVALAGDTEGVAIFQPLQRVRRQLGPGGRVVIDGPSLPTQRAGFHRVRLRLVEPAPTFTPQSIRYLVAQPAPREVETLEASGPPEAGRLDAGSRFLWEAQPRAGFYQLEFFEPEPGRSGPELHAVAPEAPVGGPAAAGELVAGVALPAGTLETRVSPATRAHLHPGATYLWRVRAVGSDGRTLAMSPLRTLRVAAEPPPTRAAPEE